MYGVGFEYGWQYAYHFMDRRLEEAQAADTERSDGSPYAAAYGAISAELGFIFSMLKNSHPEAFEAVLEKINKFK